MISVLVQPNWMEQLHLDSYIKKGYHLGSIESSVTPVHPISDPKLLRMNHWIWAEVTSDTYAIHSGYILRWLLISEGSGHLLSTSISASRESGTAYHLGNLGQLSIQGTRDISASRTFWTAQQLGNLGQLSI